MHGNDGVSMDRLRRQQKVLAEFGLHAFRSDDLDGILHLAAELVARGLDVKLAKVLELLPSGEELLVRAGVNWQPGVVGVARFGSDSNSPAGYALSHDEPVISSDLATETRFRIPDVLVQHGIESMVNVIIAGENGAFGVLEVDAPQHREFDEDDVAFLSNYANLLAAAIGRHRTHRAEEAAAREQRLMAQELAHRVKNMLALVQALVGQTVADEPAARDLRDSLLGRLQALSRAEELLFEDHVRALDLAELAERALEPFAGTAGRLLADGPRLQLPARSGRILALVLHELATNATKYGALSAPAGVVRLSWATEPTCRRADCRPDRRAYEPRIAGQAALGRERRTACRAAAASRVRHQAADGPCRVRAGWPGGTQPSGEWFRVRTGVPGNGRMSRQEASRTGLSGSSILVAEDDPLIAAELQDLLASEGAEVMGPVPTVRAAMAVIGAATLDIAVLDVNLRGASSAPVADALRAAAVPFVLVTGYAGHLLDDACLRDVPMLAKPVRANELIALLEVALTRVRQRPPEPAERRIANASRTADGRATGRTLAGRAPPR